MILPQVIDRSFNGKASNNWIQPRALIKSFSPASSTNFFMNIRRNSNNITIRLRHYIVLLTTLNVEHTSALAFRKRNAHLSDSRVLNNTATLHSEPRPLPIASGSPTGSRGCDGISYLVESRWLALRDQESLVVQCALNPVMKLTKTILQVHYHNIEFTYSQSKLLESIMLT